jgi:hypothetical protein
MKKFKITKIKVIMKNTILPLIVICLLLLACTKEDVPSVNNTIERKVQFELYTNRDFSNNNDSITFSVVIRKVDTYQVLWYSVFTPMKIKQIPGFANKIIVNKVVPNNDTSLLKVGFEYTIKNIGNSQFSDTFNTGNNLKVISFNFQ